jgi:hypothetical protein
MVPRLSFCAAAPVMPLKTIQKVWPKFPPTYTESDDGEEEEKEQKGEENKEDEGWRASPYSS